jgi:hypothetical protein
MAHAVPFSSSSSLSPPHSGQAAIMAKNKKMPVIRHTTPAGTALFLTLSMKPVMQS